MVYTVHTDLALGYSFEHVILTVLFFHWRLQITWMAQFRLREDIPFKHFVLPPVH